MLDDLKYIHERDASDALGAAEKQYQQLKYDFDLPATNFTPQNIVYSAMGGSALAALFSQTWPGYTVPFEIVRGYDIPAYVSDKTLFIASSYSGSTEETLSTLAQAEAKGAHIMIITGGGKLAEIARDKGYALALLPKTELSRYTLSANVKALLSLVKPCHALAVENACDQLEAQTDFLQTAATAWRPDVKTADNVAKQLAQELMGKSVAVYSGPKLFPGAYKWKLSINENAKQLAWTNQLPEFSHNEFTGWTKQPIEKPYAVVEIRSSLEHARIQERFTVGDRLLSGLRPSPIVVTPHGTTLLEQLLWSCMLGDFVGIYLGLLNGLDPTPLPLVEKLKQTLAA
ncbi:MAG: SIS domain-containing protein [Candidatus Saccharibacteria bacterium]